MPVTGSASVAKRENFEVFALSLGRWAFCSKSQVLDHVHCDAIVAEAEARAQKLKGWNTGRHYTVPTTDMNVHELPNALCILNTALRDEIFPVLAWQFGVEAHRLRVFDAFVVKYDAAAQRSLPVHTDQSILSGVVALNDGVCFKGGGTFFPDLNRAVLPPKGCLLTFPGSVEHGGHTLEAGLRYILALFFYAV